MNSVMGIREFISKILAFFTSIAVMYILSTVVFPSNFIIIFIAAFVFMIISFMLLTLMREAPYDAEPLSPPILSHLKNMILLPIRDKKFRMYILFVVFSYGILFMGGLYTIIGLDRFNAQLAPDSLSGAINIITALSSAIFALAIGKISEKLGKFHGFLIISVTSTILPIMLIFCHNFYLYLVIIFFSGAINSIWFIELVTIIGFAVPEKRHEYIGFISVVKLFLILIYTNAGGFLADYVTPNAALAVSSMFCLIGLGILVFRLRTI
jgi:MFS family permease